MEAQETVTHLLYQQVRRFGDRIAYHYPDNGQFVPVTWQGAYATATEIGMGLWQLGARKGDRIALVSQTRHEWTLTDHGSMGIGTVLVGIYPSETADQTRYIIDHSGAAIAVLEDAGQLAKLNEVRAELPGLKQVILIDANGAVPGDWITLDDLRQQGRELLTQSPDLPEQCREAIQPEDMATIIYTSGTTGRPKGAALTHYNLYSIILTVTEAISLTEQDTTVVYLPMSHVFQRGFRYCMIQAGTVGYYAEAITKVIDTCQIARPTVLAAVPRVYEKVHARVMAGVAQSPPARQALFHRALAVGLARSRCIQQKQPVPLMTRLQYALFDKLVFSKLRARLFGDQIQYLITGAAPISVELMEFFHAIGLFILEGYGMTEGTGVSTVNRHGDFKFGTVGRILSGSELKIAEDGEILLRGPGVFGGYFNAPDANREAFNEDGWFHGGDIGELDDDGFLRITDRKKNIIVTAGGKNVAPARIETPIMNHPYISQAVVHGDKRKYLVALITLAGEEITQWAEENGKTGLSLAELAHDEAVQAMVAEEVERQNANLASYETVKYFRILPEEFSVEAGTLTPSLKIKRKVIEEKYRHLLDEMYMMV